MPYGVDEADFWDSLAGEPQWVLEQVSLKITQIEALEVPRSQGGEYRGKWAYTSGKLQILAVIDDGARCVRLLKLLRLP